ncbi:uncharacterized protein KY384_008997 [Bacidia gigantensis]|uniref:uncharacterized protein n=1 Tax=Bacidia gigantensis TaxID=2732470 RepID=UPI001D057223|nr:uncharacterized protein KY384_008997 [Bacidia gigantensis]KAG8525353.1 hypothetical protein KY384_008997 [Bacidia gigantensis]
MPRPTSLSLAVPPGTSAVSSTVTSPTDDGSGMSSPVSTNPNHTIPGGASRHHKTSKSVPHNGSGRSSPREQPSSPDITSLPPFPPSPQITPKHGKESSKGFLSSLKNTKVSNRGPPIESTVRQVSEDTPRAQSRQQQQKLYSLKKASGSTPDLSLSSFDVHVDDNRAGLTSERSKRPIGASVGGETIANPSPTEPSFSRKPKPRFTNLIKRTQSIRTDNDGRRSKPTTPVSGTGPGRHGQLAPNDSDETSRAPQTAPLHPDRSLQAMMGSNIRGRSTDRPSSNHSSDHGSSRQGRPANSASNSHVALPGSNPGSHKENSGSHLFANIKNTSSKAADGIGRAGKGLFGKMNRRPSSTGREEGRHEPKIITLPLIEQTRKTRIAARLEDSRDKTEFWMPALPWRCIDYLNFRGCEEEGLYRIAGSEVQIRHWQKRFDVEHDIDLFAEPELYDINIIASILKAWLRDLPDEILPKSTQYRIQKEHPDAKEVPQMLKDELSNLPPCNYYLLFAITCHLSLLTAYAEKNKMNYHNLSVCFQPCMKMDPYCFRFLVEHWRDCWQGCHTEKEALEDEYRLLDGTISSGVNSSNSSTAIADDRDTTTPPNTGARNHQSKPAPLNFRRAGNEAPPATPAGIPQEANGHIRTASQLPELAPMKPLSPLTGEFSKASPKKTTSTSQG